MNELYSLIRTDLADEMVSFTHRVLITIGEAGLNPLEIYRAIETGVIVRYEVPPSCCEIRLEIGATQGDMAKHVAVVYLSKDHKLFVEDIRDRK
jgi:hypothetical protein